MAKKVYIGVDDIARRVKKIYIGVGGVAKKVRKGYIGVGGIARLFFSGLGPAVYSREATPLTNAKWDIGSATVGDYAIFAGGREAGFSNLNYYKSDVAAYDRRLTKASPTSLDIGRCPAGTSVGNYAIFAGGEYVTGSSDYPNDGTAVDVYSSSLTKVSADPLDVPVDALGATSVGNYALFAGGHYVDGHGFHSETVADVTSYDTSLVKGIVTPLQQGRSRMGATTIGDYALFAGGGFVLSSVETYNSSLTRGSAGDLKESGTYIGATSNRKYALFAGGWMYSSGDYYRTQVTAYNRSLTKTYPEVLSKGRYDLGAAYIDNNFIFAGGEASGSTDYYTTDRVDLYDDSLTRTTGPSLPQSRRGMGAASVGDYALFAGGQYQNSSSTNIGQIKDTVYAYKV